MAYDTRFIFVTTFMIFHGTLTRIFRLPSSYLVREDFMESRTISNQSVCIVDSTYIAILQDSIH